MDQNRKIISKSKEHNYMGIGVSLIIIISALWGANWYFLFDQNDRGTFGDMFGAVNSLFSGLAFSGIIITILLQRQELAFQREELAHTREEIRGQKEQMELQNETLNIQRFENTFFSMVRLFSEQTETLKTKWGENEIYGKDCFRIFKMSLQRRHMQNSNNKQEDLPTSIDVLYEKFYANYHVMLGHYFRTLYNIVKFVDQSSVNNKNFYINLVRAQLSSNELFILFYNCNSKHGSSKFKPLIEKYALLKALPMDYLLNPEHYDLYKQSAFRKLDSV